jgi:hypothetical protein
VSHLGEGTPAEILPVEADEAHIQVARSLNQTIRGLSKSILPNFWLP